MNSAADTLSQRERELTGIISANKLAAYVQLISAYESAGRVSEIGPALRRAQWLVTRIDAAKYEGKPLLNTPGQWQTLLAWIDETGDHEPE